MLFIIALAVILLIDIPYLSFSQSAYAKALPLDGNFVAGGALAYGAMAGACALSVKPGDKMASAKNGALLGLICRVQWNHDGYTRQVYFKFSYSRPFVGHCTVWFRVCNHCLTM